MILLPVYTHKGMAHRIRIGYPKDSLIFSNNMFGLRLRQAIEDIYPKTSFQTRGYIKVEMNQ